MRIILTLLFSLVHVMVFCQKDFSALYKKAEDFIKIREFVKAEELYKKIDVATFPKNRRKHYHKKAVAYENIDSINYILNLKKALEYRSEETIDYDDFNRTNDACIRLADYYFTTRNYENAILYYDSSKIKYFGFYTCGNAVAGMLNDIEFKKLQAYVLLDSISKAIEVGLHVLYREFDTKYISPEFMEAFKKLIIKKYTLNGFKEILKNALVNMSYAQTDIIFNSDGTIKECNVQNSIIVDKIILEPIYLGICFTKNNCIENIKRTALYQLFYMQQ